MPMMKLLTYVFIFVMFTTSTVVFALDGDTTKTSSNFELKPDDPVLMMIDNAMISKYFESLGIGEDMPKSSKFKYSVDSVPDFDNETYVRRMKKLDANSPFNFVYNAHVKAYINLYAKRRKKITAKMLGLAPIYFPIFEEQLDKHNLPLELKYLAIVESALNPKAKSRVGASGLWQFMYETGKMYNLNVTSYHDERNDVYKSTEAACLYLKSLYKMYNNWDLALAAYNCGPGNVNKAIRRSGGKTDFWEIMSFLPRETNGYVPAFMAVAYVMNFAAEHNIQPIKPQVNCFKVDTVMVQNHVTFAQISQALDIPMEFLEYFNPTYKQNFIPATGKGNTLCLPAEKIGLFLTNENQIYALNAVNKPKEKEALDLNIVVEPQRNQSIVYKVKSGDGLAKIAQQYHCRTTQIKEWNNLKSDRLQVGQTLHIYPKASAATQQKVQEVKSSQLNAARVTSDQKYVYYTVKPGDTFYKIAAKFEGTSVDDILKLNKGLDPRSLKQGAKIKIKPVG
jgi:membrane-bound lytic murein transglycosylase D